MEDKIENGNKLPLIEDFYTLQGEGYYAGFAAYFIRLGGCDIGCKWCDTKISWKASVHQLTSVKTIVAQAVSYAAKSVVVTGGEPTIYPLENLCKELKRNNINTFIETAGTNPITGQWDWICLSPKTNKPPRPEFFLMADELKVIIETSEDIKWAEENAQKVKKSCRLYLQPEWSRREKLMPFIINYIKQNPQWRISLQIHKYMHIP